MMGILPVTCYESSHSVLAYKEPLITLLDREVRLKKVNAQAFNKKLSFDQNINTPISFANICMCIELRYILFHNQSPRDILIK